jgi:predicted MFS family arabinose efflux permease
MTYPSTATTWLSAAPKPSAMKFAVLFAIESLARATISGVVSIQAYDLVHSSQKVSEIYTIVGVLTLCGTLIIPTLIAWTARRFIYSLGAVCLMLAAAAFITFTIPGQMGGMLLRNFGAACLSITLNLYILDHIPRTTFVRAEPLRLAMSTASWTLGPALGIYLYTRYGVWAPHCFAAAVALVVLILFAYLRLTEAIGPARLKPPANPLKGVSRFMAQPRLRLAWLVAFGRSCFWTTFFTYGPLLMVTSGMSKTTGGLLVSAGNAVLVTAVLAGRIAERIGLRKVIAGSYILAAFCAAAAGIAGVFQLPVLAASLLIGGALAASCLDGIGSIPFLRAVRTRERAAMTGVYRTYLELSDLIPSAVFAVALLFAPVSVTFVILALWLMICGAICWIYLPRSL